MMPAMAPGPIDVTIPPPFDAGAPATVAASAEALRRLLNQGHDFLSALPEPVFFARQGDRWSPVEHARHLRKSYIPVTLALRLPVWLLRRLLGAPRRPPRDYARLEADYERALAAGGQAGRFAPSPEPPPRDAARRRTQVLGAWQRSGLALATAADRWSEADAQRARLRHPLLGGLTMGEMVAFSTLHTVHHLELVRQRLG